MRVLVTRADDRAEATAGRLRTRGHSVLTIPMTRIVATGAPLPPGRFAGIIATSPRAISLANSAIARGLKEMTLYAVGQGTAKEAQRQGFADVVIANGTAMSLAALIAGRHHGDMPFLYLAGYDRKPQLQARLAESGLAVRVVVIYRAEEVAALTQEQIRSLSEPPIEAVLHYSRRSAEIFCRLTRVFRLETLVRSVRHCCISADTAIPLQAIGGLDIRIAAVPEEAFLLEQL
jgi:uroporphyrinogen-III synthase